MSVEHMLRDTSIARMTVACPVGTVAIVIGRPSATTMLASARQSSANGRWRRIQEERGAASRMRPRLE